MKLSDAGPLNIDIRKLEDYCLSPSHPRGRHKARVFARALGNAGRCRVAARSMLRDGPAAEVIDHDTDQFGERITADVAISRQGRTVVIRSVWMVRDASVNLVTCWML